MKTQEVWIFYSGGTEPEIPTLYAEGIAYLHENRIKTHVIDIDKNPEFAEKFKIMATPFLLIKEGKEEHRYIGLVDGLKKLISNDLLGLSILHFLGFRDGRMLARNFDLSKQKERREIEGILKEMLGPRGIYDFKLMEFDVIKARAEVALKLKIENEGNIKALCKELSAFLGGIFTEIFGMGVMAEEKRCMSCGDEFCEFEIKERVERGKKENIAEMVRRAIK